MEQFAGVAEAFVVAGPVRNVGEPWGEMCFGVADEPGFGGEPQQGLDHGEGDEFCIGEFGGDPDSGSFGRPLWVFDQQVVDGDVESCGEGVQVRVHALCPWGSGFVSSPLIVDTLATRVGDDRAERANPLELLV